MNVNKCSCAFAQVILRLFMYLICNPGAYDNSHTKMLYSEEERPSIDHCLVG